MSSISSFPYHKTISFSNSKYHILSKHFLLSHSAICLIQYILQVVHICIITWPLGKATPYFPAGSLPRHSQTQSTQKHDHGNLLTNYASAKLLNYLTLLSVWRGSHIAVVVLVYVLFLVWRKRSQAQKEHAGYEMFVCPITCDYATWVGIKRAEAGVQVCRIRTGWAGAGAHKESLGNAIRGWNNV